MNLDFSVIPKYMPLVFKSFGMTLQITGLSLLLGFVIAIPLTLCKISRSRVLRGIAYFYTSIFRGVPQLVQLFLVYFAVPQLFAYKITAMQASVLAFACNSAAFLSENLRGGIQAVDAGQREAAIALGVPYPRMMCDIIFPQAIKSTLPSVINEIINLLKGTSLVATIGLVDIMRTAQLGMNSTYKAFEPFLVSALIYYIIVMLLTLLAHLVERKVHKSDKR